MKHWLATLGFFVGLVALWELAVRTGIVSHVLMPTPGEVGAYLINSIKDNTLITGIFLTIKRLLLGYAAGLVLGMPLGLLNARFKFFAATIGLLALGLQALPSVCWAPLSLLWFGQTEAAMFFIVIMGSLWSITLAAEAGVRNVPPIYARAARTMGSSGFHTWMKVILPASLPYIVTGMKQGWAFAWRSLMAAEIYIVILTGLGSLGQLLHFGRELHAMDQVIGIMIVIIAIGLVTDKVLFSPIERFMHKRWGTAR